MRTQPTTNRRVLFPAFSFIAAVVIFDIIHFGVILPKFHRWHDLQEQIQNFDERIFSQIKNIDQSDDQYKEITEKFDSVELMRKKAQSIWDAIPTGTLVATINGATYIAEGDNKYVQQLRKKADQEEEGAKVLREQFINKIYLSSLANSDSALRGVLLRRKQIFDDRESLGIDWLVPLWNLYTVVAIALIFANLFVIAIIAMILQPRNR